MRGRHGQPSSRFFVLCHSDHSSSSLHLNMSLNKDTTFKSVSDFWDTSIIPTLSDYVKIPNQSPAYDPDWASNGMKLKKKLFSIASIFGVAVQLTSSSDTQFSSGLLTSSAFPSLIIFLNRSD